MCNGPLNFLSVVGEFLPRRVVDVTQDQEGATGAVSSHPEVETIRGERHVVRLKTGRETNADVVAVYGRLNVGCAPIEIES